MNAIDVDCPLCCAKRGGPCRTPSNAVAKDMHLSRRQRARMTGAKKLEDAQSALRVIRTWARYALDNGQTYNALENIVNLAVKTLEKTK